MRTDLVTGYSLGYSLVDIVKTYYTGSWPMVQQETKTQNFILFYSIGFEMSYSMNEKLYISTGPMFRFGINGKEPFSNDIISISWKLKIGLAYS